ncbi:hypothetical protein QBC34DRAFT_421640 [Podospora aff. communis PSN243]|uniref:Secreted protein n=1 Tax=Podospora aff. communis PSN243 TaxID=3040156 RepID=A0AAV9H1Z5_9PEZI|nr:hypothetical protein QBC34DRAFT_421640 [Podospora aff. communis PSN243]
MSLSTAGLWWGTAAASMSRAIAEEVNLEGPHWEVETAHLDSSTERVGNAGDMRQVNSRSCSPDTRVGLGTFDCQKWPNLFKNPKRRRSQATGALGNMTQNPPTDGIQAKEGLPNRAGGRIVCLDRFVYQRHW